MGNSFGEYKAVEMLKVLRLSLPSFPLLSPGCSPALEAQEISMAPAASHPQYQGLDPGLPFFSEDICFQEENGEQRSVEG